MFRRQQLEYLITDVAGYRVKKWSSFYNVLKLFL